MDFYCVPQFKIIVQVLPDIFRAVSGKLAHYIDTVLPFLESGFTAPPAADVFFDFGGDDGLHLVDFIHYTLRFEGCVDMVSEAANKIGFEFGVLQQ